MAGRIRTAVFPVGGLGTRFLPATKSLPKEMLPLVDKPIIQYAVEEAASAGIEEFIFVTGRGKQSIEDHFDRSFELECMLEERGKAAELDQVRRWSFKPGQVAYTRQQEPLGLGHAVWCARDLVGNEPFAVLLADDVVLSRTPCLAQMMEAHATVGGNLVATMDVAREHVSRYGVIDTSAAADATLVPVQGLVEKPTPQDAPSTLAVIGRYLLQPEIFDVLGNGVRGAGGEIQLTDAMAQLIGQQPFHGLRFDGRRFDCGDKLGFLEATIAFALARDDLGADMQRIVDTYATRSPGAPGAAGAAR